MKKLILSGALMLGSFGLFAQTSASLPQNSQDYIKKNFSSATIETTKEESSWEFWDKDEKYEVHLSNGIKLDFNKNGEITEIDSKNNEAIPEAALPKEVVTYVQSNYSGNKIISWEKNDDEQEVELADGTELEFDAQGNFRKVD
ncbi:MAG: PepSY-like domain-containing protein [Salinimicrobium sediminis]|nr:PepSY-like domain-containing protein [Salinimicrobium sediminis]